MEKTHVIKWDGSSETVKYLLYEVGKSLDIDIQRSVRGEPVLRIFENEHCYKVGLGETLIIVDSEISVLSDKYATDLGYCVTIADPEFFAIQYTGDNFMEVANWMNNHGFYIPSVVGDIVPGNWYVENIRGTGYDIFTEEEFEEIFR